MIAHHLDALFPGMEIADYDFFRVTRDADLAVSDEADDLLQAVEDELRRRRFGEVVRVEVGRDAARLLGELTASRRRRDVYPVDGMLDLGALWQLVRAARPRRAARGALVFTHPRLLRHETSAPT